MNKLFYAKCYLKHVAIYIPAQSHMGLPPDQKYIQTYKQTNKQTNIESANCSPAKTYVFNIGKK